MAVGTGGHGGGHSSGTARKSALHKHFRVVGMVGMVGIAL
jgi:hypothetical protein